MMRASAAALGLVAGLSVAAAAQQVELDTVDARLGRGDYDGARAALDAWWRASDGGEAASGRARARALLLRARLGRDLEAAEPDYLAVVLGYPTTPFAAEALLRLGQGLVIAGSPGRAVEYLERYRRDFPDHRDADAGLLWLLRAHRGAGDERAACTAVRDRSSEPNPDDARLRSLIEREAAAACTAAATVVVDAGDAGDAGDTPAAADTAARRDTDAAPTERPEPPAPPETTSRRDTAVALAPAEAEASARFAVQTGAFRRERGAETVAARLRRAGYTPRLVYVPGSALLRVRVGRFERQEEAAALARRLRDAGFPVVVVGDVHRERER